MKTLKKSKFILVMLVVVAITAMTSCTSDDDAGGDPAAAVAGAGQIVATIDGSVYQSLAAGTTANITNNNGTEFLQITSVNLGGEAVTITVIRPTIETAAYDFDSNLNITATITYTRIDAGTFESDSFVAPFMDSGDVGTITITELTSNNIRGTFNAMMSNQDTNQIIDVTGGSFDIPVTRM
ncbi:MAG: DUF6252 family protein [Nonlabens sp.]